MDAQASLAEKLAELGQPTRCPECSGPWSTVSRVVNESFKQAKDPEKGALSARTGVALRPYEYDTVVVSWLAALECENGHRREFVQFTPDFAPAGEA